jgi:A/G-specific adenine glycosylase
MTDLPRKVIGAAVIWRDGKILIDRRKTGGAMGGLWEFPGGKVEPGETISDCILREIREELGITIAVGEPLITIEHAYDTFVVELHVHHCQHVEGEPQTIECDEIRYVTVDELDQYEFPAANVEIINALKQAA